MRAGADGDGSASSTRLVRSRERGRQLIEQLGMRLKLAGPLMISATSRARRRRRRPPRPSTDCGYDLSRDLGETGYLSTTACHLGRVALCTGPRRTRRLRLSEEAEAGSCMRRCRHADQAGEPFGPAFSRTRGSVEEAERLARKAVELVPARRLHRRPAGHPASLGEVLAQAGKARGGARKAFAEALASASRRATSLRPRRARARLAGSRASRSSRVSRRRISRASPPAPERPQAVGPRCSSTPSRACTRPSQERPAGRRA